MPVEGIQRGIRSGVRKVNIDTAIRLVLTGAACRQGRCAAGIPSRRLGLGFEYHRARIFAPPPPGDTMKRSQSLAVAAFTLLAAASLPASASLALAQKNACVACHAVDKKLLGPAYTEVAKKYAGQKDAAAALAASIKKGGSGKWGQIPMPAQPNLSEADALALANWILGGAK